MGETDWIAVDWGTTHLRAWRMSGATATAQAQSDAGMGTLTRDGYEPALLSLIGGWIGDGDATVVACGMVGSRQGWVEAPYGTIPTAPLSGHFALAPTTRAGLRVHVIPGLRQNHPADVMRGEETQIAGFVAQNPGWDGVLCLPGTHTKWVHLSAGEVVSFQTFMTGDMFAALGQATVLRHSLGGDGWDETAFQSALGDSLTRPERIAARLFSIRAQGLLHGLPAGPARAQASGLLIGAELAAARPYWLGQSVAIIGGGTIAGIYDRALASVGLVATVTDGTAITLAGLTAAHTLVKETT